MSPAFLLMVLIVVLGGSWFADRARIGRRLGRLEQAIGIKSDAELDRLLRDINANN